MFSELKKEIAPQTALICWFRLSNERSSRLIIDDLQHFAERGGRLRVITTTYMGATDVKGGGAAAILPTQKSVYP